MQYKAIIDTHRASSIQPTLSRIRGNPTMAPYSWRLCLAVLLARWTFFVPFSEGLAVVSKPSARCDGGRHICLLENLENVQGPYFCALFDQLLEQTDVQQRHLAYCTTKEDLKRSQRETDADTFLNELGETLDLHITQLILLDDTNPLALENVFSTEKPTDPPPNILWVQGHNAFRTRHFLRTSGMDRWITERCGGDGSSSSSSPASVYVGERAGALCAGPTMDVAHVRGDDLKQSPELQVHGLGLLGNRDWVSFGMDRETLEENSRTKDIVDNIHVCDEDQVFVWSQERRIPGDDNNDDAPLSEEATTDTTATRFIMTPHRKGTIERYTTPERLPALVTSSAVSMEGVACTGEPSIDPSRQVSNPLGDSEWLEEFQEN